MSIEIKNLTMYVPLQTEKEVYSMLNSNISTDLLELKDVNIDSVENYSDLKVIKCHLESKEDRICPVLNMYIFMIIEPFI